MSRVRSAASLALALGLGLAGACFTAPQPAVQFSCDPEQAPACPDGYTCEPDGCCHLVGTDYAAYEGQCQLGAIPLPTSGAEAGTDATSTTAPADATSTTDSADGTTDDPTGGSSTESGSGSSGETGTASSTGDASSGSTSSGSTSSGSTG